jgi:hypothetical protein
VRPPGYSPEPSTGPLLPPPDLTPPEPEDDDTADDEPDDEDEDDEQVQCWHIEPHTPCDWNICRQPERLARGDYGTDPALGLATPTLDRIRHGGH